MQGCENRDTFHDDKHGHEHGCRLLIEGHSICVPLHNVVFRFRFSDTDSEALTSWHQLLKKQLCNADFKTTFKTTNEEIL